MSERMLYWCGSLRRREQVRNADAALGQRLLNGIDFLEVASEDQRTLELTFIRPLPGETGGVPAAPVLGGANLIIEGGERVRGIDVESVSANGNVLTIVVDRAGDFSTYTLRLVAGPGGGEPPDGFDPQLAEVSFSFKAGCPSDFDCVPEDVCPPEPLPAPLIDYLAKDYASFRRLMLDRMAVTIPDWQERNPSDLGVTIIELLAYAADHLSYQQDAVATESYLGTARRRVSVRRHARLLDYPMHDGAAARVWIALTIDPAADGVVLPGPQLIESGASSDAPGTLFLTRTAGLAPRIDDAQAEHALRTGAEPFEALHDLTLRAACNELRFYTWGDEDCCLPRGATRAWLRNRADELAELAPGRVLVFEQVRGEESGRREDADPARRHAVRLTAVTFVDDPLNPDEPDGDENSERLRVARISWHSADALPFTFCLRDVPDPERPGERAPVTVAYGNVVLAEHGRTLAPRPLPRVNGGRYRPALADGPLAFSPRVARADGTLAPLDPAAPASSAMNADPRAAVPAVYLRENTASNRRWTAQRDLLDGDAFDREFVAEPEEDGAITLRFGDGVHGSMPASGARFDATYRVGGGRRGNIGADAIAHVHTGDPGILAVRNPLAARGGADPEPLEHVRLYAPQAFRTQERAVTEADYAAAAQRHPAVQRATATFRWTGSWHTVFLTVDRVGGLPVDAEFEQELVSFLDRFSLAGYDLEIEPPRFVPLDIAFTVCVHPGILRADVHHALLETFSNRNLPDGRRGFFHPDNFTFGQPVYLSRIIAAAMAVPGVKWVDADTKPPKTNRFKRWSEPARDEADTGVMRMARLEIARLDNDASLPENGRIEFFMEGGL